MLHSRRSRRTDFELLGERSPRIAFGTRLMRSTRSLRNFALPSPPLPHERADVRAAQMRLSTHIFSPFSRCLATRRDRQVQRHAGAEAASLETAERGIWDRHESDDGTAWARGGCRGVNWRDRARAHTRVRRFKLARDIARFGASRAGQCSPKDSGREREDHNITRTRRGQHSICTQTQQCSRVSSQ